MVDFQGIPGRKWEGGKKLELIRIAGSGVSCYTAEGKKGCVAAGRGA